MMLQQHRQKTPITGPVEQQKQKRGFGGSTPCKKTTHSTATIVTEADKTGLASADRLPVVVRIPAGPLGSLKCDPPKGNGRCPQKRQDLWCNRIARPKKQKNMFCEKAFVCRIEPAGKAFRTSSDVRKHLFAASNHS